MVDIVVVQDAQVGSGAVCAAAGMGYALLSGISAALMRMVWEGDMKGVEMRQNSVERDKGNIPPSPTSSERAMVG